MVRELEEIPEQAVFLIMALGGLDDERQGLVVDVGPQESVALDAVFFEGHLEHDRVLVSIHELVLVGPPSKRAVHEELRPLGAFLREAGHQLTGIDDQVLADSKSIPFFSIHSLSTSGREKTRMPLPSRKR